jgi:hypothetical protein
MATPETALEHTNKGTVWALNGDAGIIACEQCDKPGKKNCSLEGCATYAVVLDGMTVALCEKHAIKFVFGEVTQDGRDDQSGD